METVRGVEVRWAAGGSGVLVGMYYSWLLFLVFLFFSSSVGFSCLLGC